MLLAPLLVPLFTLSPDSTAWNLYAPKETDVRFQMPGKLVYETLGTPETKYVGRFRSLVGGYLYTIVVGDVGATAAPIYEKLWAKDRYGKDVQKLLGMAVDGAADEKKGKVVANRFGERKGFPVQFAAIELPDGTGSVISLTFTKKGIVFAGVNGQRSKKLSDEGTRLLAGLDLSKRR